MKLVYPTWQTAIVEHVNPPEGRLIGGIDFGWTNPFVALGASHYTDDNDRDCIYIWFERYRTKALLRDHARALPAGHLWAADPSAPQQIAELCKEGYRVHAAAGNIEDGINAVNARIENGTLTISKRCRALTAEMGAYQYDVVGGSDKPLSEFNHACDALRYLVMAAQRPAAYERELADLRAQRDSLLAALEGLYEACMRADEELNLSEEVDGQYLDAAREAIAAAKGAGPLFDAAIAEAKEKK